MTHEDTATEPTITDSELFAAIVKAAPDAIIVAGVDGCIRFWNAGAERVFGHLASEVMGQSLDIIIPERLRKAHWDAFDRAVQAGRTRYEGRAMTTRSMRKDGAKIYVDMTFALLTDGTGAVAGALAIAHDVTARHESERALRERAAGMERALSEARGPAGGGR
ncbi:MAG TPA: PAS domain S-box protein [Casimicrobiaceae bacterium]|nr:PAS domain S-box protein [Casimicrobiaceae bacterium]